MGITTTWWLFWYSLVQENKKNFGLIYIKNLLYVRDIIFFWRFAKLYIALSYEKQHIFLCNLKSL